MLIRLLRRKGQAIASDFIISLTIFLIIITGSAIIWNTTVLKYSQSKQNQFMQDKAFSITDTLVRTPGYPPQWSKDNVKLIGLSEGSPNMLNKSKLVEFKDVSYDFARRIWGIGGYEYYIRITNASDDLVVLDGTALEYGIAPAGKKDLVPMKRLVLINDSGNLIRAALLFMIWR